MDPKTSSNQSDIISPEIAWQKIRSGALLIDVRSSDEFKEGHLTQALNVPHTEISDKISGIESDKQREIVLHCKSGGRSGKAKDTLIQMGYSRVFNAGGYEDLRIAEN